MRDKETSANAQEEAHLASPPRPYQETARLGKELYARDIRCRVEADYDGHIVAIDVGGGWAVADVEVGLVDRLRDVHPGAVNILRERVGFRGFPGLGAVSVRRLR